MLPSAVGDDDNGAVEGALDDGDVVGLVLGDADVGAAEGEVDGNAGVVRAAFRVKTPESVHVTLAGTSPTALSAFAVTPVRRSSTDDDEGLRWNMSGCPVETIPDV